METNREPRRKSMIAANGLSRRRQRTSTTLRDSPEEDEQVELQESVRLRDRVRKKERDRELSNQNKRKRGDKYVHGSNRDEVEQSSEESEDNNEDDYEEEDRPITRSPSLSNNSHRKRFATARVVRSSPAWKPDEIIAVPVPRKARSASAKRSHENCVDGPLPSSSSVSARKKMRPIGFGPKTRLPKASPPKFPSSSSSAQNDIEIEVAEALYDLMKQSQSPKKQETTFHNQAEKLDSKRKRTEDVKDEEENAVVLTQNGSTSVPSVTKADSEQRTKTETGISTPKLEKKAIEELATSQAMVSESFKSQKEAVKQEKNTKPPTQGLGLEGGGDGIVAKEESPPYTELDVDPVDSTRTKANLMVSEVKKKPEAKFEIDLMAPAPMASCPERNDVINLVADLKTVVQDVEMTTETTAKYEHKPGQRVKNGGVELEDKSIHVKQEPPKLDLEKPDQNNGGISSSNRLHKLDQKQQQSNESLLEGEKSAQSSSLPLPIAVAGWPDSLPLGYMPPPLQTIVPMGGTTGSPPAVQQPEHFILSQPWPKRCATHHYIARNIYYHQKVSKLNHTWPVAAGPASVYGAKPYNLNVVPSAQNMIHCSPLIGGFPSENVQGLESVPITRKDKSSEVVNILDATQKKQLVLQQAPQPVPAGNLPHGPAFIFPLSQYQTVVGKTTASESGLPKSAVSASNGPLSGNSATGAPVGSSSLPAVVSAVSFNHPNFPANEAPPYMAILQNNGYPFPISTHVGMLPPFIGGNHAPAMSFFNGSFYSSPVFHSSQDQQQRPRSQPLVQPAHQTISTSNGSSSPHRQRSQKQPATQVNGNNFITSTTTQLQNPHKQHLRPSTSSQKHEAEITEGDKPLLTYNQAQKVVYNQNFAVPIQPMNFTLMAPMILGTGGGGGGGGSNHGEKQQQQLQQQGAKGGELIPHAFSLSFTSFNGSGTPSALNFSSMAHNSTIFQTLPDIARHGYQLASAPHVVKQKNEGKTGGGDSTNLDDGRKAILGKSPTSFGQSLAFSKPGCTDPSASLIVGTTCYDTSARTLNYISSSVPENWPSFSTSTTSVTADAVTDNPPNSQQLNGAARIKATTSSSMPASSTAGKFSNNIPAFSQILVQTNNSGQSPHWKNLARTSASQVSSSLAAATSSTLKNLPQQQVRNPQGQTQISFGGNSKSGTALHGQKIVISTSSGSSSKTASKSSKASQAISTLPSQQSESSSNGPSQKASPVCGRNVPSILSTRPSHLSELEY